MDNTGDQKLAASTETKEEEFIEEPADITADPAAPAPGPQNSAAAQEVVATAADSQTQVGEQENDDGGEGAARTTKRKRTPPRSEKDAETDKKKLLRVLEKITATAEGILADERKESAKTAKAAKVGGGGGEEDDDDDEKATKKEERKKTGEFVDATAKWTLLLDQNDSGEETMTTASSGFDVHPAAMYCALVASAFE